MKLVIVESPTKAKTISKFLGKGFDVESSFGHVRDLPKSKLGVDVENNYEPHYIIPLKARKNVTALKKKAKKAEEVILATDEDREGEAIAWHLAEALGLDNDHRQRIVFHEITKSAIEHALLSPRPLDTNLINAQQARRILDRLVGYNLSPFLWKKVARGLSAGRVQSVAVRLIVERETEIDAFKKDEYWTIEGLFQHGSIEIPPFLGLLQAIDQKALEKFDISNELRAREISDDVKTATAHISHVEKKQEHKNVPTPFTTSTLQQTAGQRLHFSAKQTMMFAQRLYEEGLITYMRTDSLNVSHDALSATAEFIKSNFELAYYRESPRIFKTKSKGAQEAHEAIRPTDVYKTPESMKSHFEDEKTEKLYSLIWSRFVASQMPEAVIENTKIDIDAKSSKHIYNFRANGARLVFDGFLKVYPMKFSENILPSVDEGGLVSIAEINPIQHFTEPPPRYNEASLIKILEKFGIGRPSTYAPTLSTIQDRGYVEKDEHRRLRPTETGKIVNGILVEHFPQIVDIDFTAKMENEFDEIAEGKAEWVPVIKEFYEPFSKLLVGKYESVESQKVEEKTDEICINCGKPMVIKRGRFGKFIACSGFPECKTTKRIPEPALKGMKCPTCLARGGTEEEIGDVVRRKSKRGRYFYGCSRWPKCDFVSWTLPGSDQQKKVPESPEKTEEDIKKTQKEELE